MLIGVSIKFHLFALNYATIMATILEKLPKNLSYFQISRIDMDSINQDLKIEFINPIETTDLFVIELGRVAFIKIAKHPEDDDGCYVIGEVVVKPVENINSEAKALGSELLVHNLHDVDDYVHIHIEGSCVLDALGVLKGIT